MDLIHNTKWKIIQKVSSEIKDDYKLSGLSQSSNRWDCDWNNDSTGWIRKMDFKKYWL